MAKEVYIGVNGVARKVKKCYIGAPNKARNHLTNGALHTSTDGWDMQPANVYTQEFVDGALRITQKAAVTEGLMYSNYQTLTEPIVGRTEAERKLVYVCAKVKGKVGNTGFPLIYCHHYLNGTDTITRTNVTADINGVSGAALNDGQWHTLSGRYQTYNPDSGNNWDYFRFAFGISATSNGQVAVGDVMDIKDFCVFDLTDIFGHGNEPSKAWCDANLVGYPDGREVEGGRIVARKVKKAYIGVNGVARLCYEGVN